jgi:hypothetical protein
MPLFSVVVMPKRIAHEGARRVPKKKEFKCFFFVTLRAASWAISFLIAVSR